MKWVHFFHEERLIYNLAYNSRLEPCEGDREGGGRREESCSEPAGPFQLWPSRVSWAQLWFRTVPFCLKGKQRGEKTKPTVRNKQEITKLRNVFPI